VAQKRLPVRKIREVLRLKAAGVSDRSIGMAVGCARSTVQACLQKAKDSGLSWPLPDELDEASLEARLYQDKRAATVRPQPDFAVIHRELSRTVHPLLDGHQEMVGSSESHQFHASAPNLSASLAWAGGRRRIYGHPAVCTGGRLKVPVLI